MSVNPEGVHNPYAAPHAEVADIAVDSTDELASRWLRLGGAIVDGIIVGGIALAIIFAVTFAMSTSALIHNELAMGLLGGLLGFAVFVLIQGYFLHSTGQTVAKKLLGMRIVDENGEKPRFGRLLGLRYAVIMFLQAIPLAGAVFGLVNALFIFRADRRCIHDLLAGTRVVMVR